MICILGDQPDGGPGVQPLTPASGRVGVTVRVLKHRLVRFVLSDEYVPFEVAREDDVAHVSCASQRLESRGRLTALEREVAEEERLWSQTSGIVR